LRVNNHKPTLTFLGKLTDKDQLFGGNAERRRGSSHRHRHRSRYYGRLQVLLGAEMIKTATRVKEFLTKGD